jgi:hypothetical protein
MKALSFPRGVHIPIGVIYFASMDWLSSYFLRNFILLCMGAILLVNAIQHYKENRRVSLFLMLITGSAVALGIAQTVMEACKPMAICSGRSSAPMSATRFAPSSSISSS